MEIVCRARIWKVIQFSIDADPIRHWRQSGKMSDSHFAHSVIPPFRQPTRFGGVAERGTVNCSLKLCLSAFSMTSFVSSQ
jgi:hypothetical protein